MTKKRNLTTFMIAIMIMLFSLPVNAQGTVGYAKWDVDNRTLTFYGGESVPEGDFGLNTGYNTPGWNSTTIKGSVTKVVFDESFKDVRPTSCYQWFRLFSKLKTIEGIENLNTEEVTNMGDMFNSCKGLENLDLSSFNTAKVTDMGYMFSGSYGLTSLDLSSFNTAKVENMSCMFSSCYGLASLDLSSFNTAEVTDMRGMFGECSGLTSLDLSSFNTDKVTNMTKMFSDCSSLNKIYVSDDFNIVKVSSSEKMFYNCTSLKKGDVSYDPNNIDHTMANYGSGYFTKSNLKPCVKWNGDTKVLTFKVANYIEGTAGECEFNEGAIALEGVDLKNNCKKVVFTPSFKQVKPTSCYQWFSGFEQLTIIQGIENLNTEEVKNMRGMFESCSRLTFLDVSKFDTENVTNMMFMFYGCKKLTSLDLSSFNTANVTNMNGMFNSCSSLTSLDLSSFDTAKVEEMSLMFGNCTGLTSLDLSKFNTAKVWEMGYMFGGCSGLTSLNLSSFNTAKVTDMMNMFVGCKGLTSLDLSSFNTANVQVMSYMFNGCSGLTTINVSDDFTIGNGCSGDNMFSSCSNLKGATSYDPGKTGIDMANFDGYFTPKTITPYVKWDANTKVLTFKVANTKEAGNGVYDLNKGANPPGWLGLEVTNYCTNVVFTPSFKQAKPTSCYQWFFGFWPLTTIEGIENLNTEEVTNMSGMFVECSNLTSLDLSSFNTAKVENMSSMFRVCSGLTSLDLSSFNTVKVTNMEGMFSGCSGLTSLDLSSFNTVKVTRMNYMFTGCSGLTTIYVSDGFTTDHNPSGSDMFSDCNNLVGAAPYNSNNTGIEMANYKDGYFKTYFTLGKNKVELCGNPLTTESLNLTGDYDFTPKYEFKAKSANYIRDLSSSESTWFSLCLPFAYTPNNFTAYQLMSATDDAVEIGEISGEIAAGTPVLFKFKDGVVDVDKKIEIFATGAQIVKAPVVGTAVNGPEGSLQLCGTYQTKTFSSEDGNAFILLNDKLMNPARMLTTPGVTTVGVKPFRAYMTLTASAQTSSARAFSIGRGDEGNEGTTAIDLLNSVATDDAEYYDINGRRIDAPAKGVNIVRRGNKTMKLIIK